MSFNFNQCIFVWIWIRSQFLLPFTDFALSFVSLNCITLKVFLYVKRERHLDTKCKPVNHEKSAAGLCWCVFFSIMCKVRVDWLLWVRLERPWHAEYVSFFFTYDYVYDYNCFRWLPQTISTFPLWYGEKSLIKFSRTHSYTSCHVQWNLKV